MTKAKDFSFLDKPLNTVYFDSPSHTGTLLSGLHELWKKGQLLDITLLAEGIAFKVLGVYIEVLNLPIFGFINIYIFPGT